MWFRYLAIAALSGVGCAGTQPPPSHEPAPVDAPAPSVDTPAPPHVGPGAEPQPEPATSVPEPAAPKPKGAKPTCAELDENQCVVTEGCEWHTTRKCLEQDKPKTLGD
ncbi:MAG TPA: hypothetical protein VFB62_07040 [Polyangiaceae bacterium]|jgi:hypothetical protein|nr:hypothetical protein [Polyangiaceae bacterium]